MNKDESKKYRDDKDFSPLPWAAAIILFVIMAVFIVSLCARLS